MEEAEERGVTIELVDTVGGLKMQGAEAVRLP
jgi:hypothetical protein